MSSGKGGGGGGKGGGGAAWLGWVGDLGGFLRFVLQLMMGGLVAVELQGRRRR